VDCGIEQMKIAPGAFLHLYQGRILMTFYMAGKIDGNKGEYRNYTQGKENEKNDRAKFHVAVI